MIIEKEYYFYAAHRNQELKDKCSNIHGHCYFLNIKLDLPQQGSITMLFSEIDNSINPIIKGKYDHSMLIDSNDPLYVTLNSCHPGEFKFVVFDKPTSVENLAFRLFSEIRAALPIVALSVRETTTSLVHYSLEDFLKAQ